tara:strand:+ start:3810 stop:4151 length:342 start_codon:yes stop_codon:yes gene_type:complete
MKDITRNCFAKFSSVLMVAAVYFFSLDFSVLSFQSNIFDENICKSHNEKPGNQPVNDLDCKNHCFLSQIDEYEFKNFSLAILKNKFVFKNENVSYYFKIPSIEQNFNSPPFLI